MSMFVIQSVLPAPGISLFPIQPLYNQPSDTAVYHQNKRKYVTARSLVDGHAFNQSSFFELIILHSCFYTYLYM